jgi:hypothetical protein
MGTFALPCRARRALTVRSCHDILTSSSDPIDLTALPPDEAEAHARRIYNCLPEDAQVSVEDDVALIDIPEESAQRAGRAIETHERDSVAMTS